MSIDHLHAVRDAELDAARAWLPPPGARLLDLGAGTGRQSALLAASGYRVTAVDLPSSAYAAQRVHPVLDYDGRHLPLEDASVDVVFSSNVLEHVVAVEDLLRETARVLAPGGLGVHVLPTPAWRWWTTLTYYPWLARRLLQRMAAAGGGHAPPRDGGPPRPVLSMLWPERHGERGSLLSEAWYFSERWWRGTFDRAGFEVVATRPVGLAYTGSMLFAGRVSIAARRRWAAFAGSACRIYVVRPRAATMHANDHR